MKRELDVGSEMESSILIVKAGRNVEKTPIKPVKDSLILFRKETLFDLSLKSYLYCQF